MKKMGLIYFTPFRVKWLCVTGLAALALMAALASIKIVGQGATNGIVILGHSVIGKGRVMSVLKYIHIGHSPEEHSIHNVLFLWDRYMPKVVPLSGPKNILNDDGLSHINRPPLQKTFAVQKVADEGINWKGTDRTNTPSDNHQKQSQNDNRNISNLQVGAERIIGVAIAFIGAIFFLRRGNVNPLGIALTALGIFIALYAPLHLLYWSARDIPENERPCAEQQAPKENHSEEPPLYRQSFPPSAEIFHQQASLMAAPKI